MSPPMGLSSLINLRYGWTDAGAAFTIPAGVTLKNLLPQLGLASKGGHILCLWSSLWLKQDPGWQKAVAMFPCCLLRLERRAAQICGGLLFSACASSLVDDIILSVELSWPAFSERCHTSLYACIQVKMREQEQWTWQHKQQRTDYWRVMKCQVEWIRLFLVPVFCTCSQTKHNFKISNIMLLLLLWTLANAVTSSNKHRYYVIYEQKS